MDDLNLDDFEFMGTRINNQDDDNVFVDMNESSNRHQMTCGGGGNKKKESVNINSLVRDIETNLENFDNSDFSENNNFTGGPLPSNEDFKHMKEHFSNDEDDISESETQTESYWSNENWDIKIHNFLFKIREPVLIILLFILLNNPELIYSINEIPIIKKQNSIYPSLIIRGFILALVIFLFRKLEYQTVV